MLDDGMLPLFEDFIGRCSPDIFAADVFSGQTIIEVFEGQYLEVEGADIVGIEHTSQIASKMYEINGYYSDGMYWAGFHIPAAEYILTATEGSALSYYSIYGDAARRILLEKGDVTADAGTYVTLEEGQFIKLTGATMAPYNN
jgi:hypothetical protein